MMATEDHDVGEWDQDSESGKLLSDAGIGGGPLAGGRLSGNRRASAPSGLQTPVRPQQPKMSMCGLLSIEFYKPYFDVDTSQVKRRLLQSAWPMRKVEPFLPLEEGAGEDPGGEDAGGSGRYGGAPDLYGPVWVSATLIFALSVVGDMRQGIGSTEFDEVSSNLYAVLAYLAIGCGGLWAFFRAHDVPLSVAEALSVYGYSLTPFLAVAPLCLFSWPFRWGGLAAASAVAAIFVLRSAWPRLQENTPERSTVILLGTVAAYHFLWFFMFVMV